jgi:hypothetical protein
MSQHFIQIQCPGCGSHEVDVLQPPTYRCQHCESTFILKGPPRPAPPPRQAPAPPRPPPNNYGPTPYNPQTTVYVHHGSGGGGAFRFVIWAFVLLMIIGGSTLSTFLGVFSGLGSSIPDVSIDVEPPKTGEDKDKDKDKDKDDAPKRGDKPLSMFGQTDETKAAGEGEAPTEDDPAGETPSEDGPIDLAKYQALAGCGCRTDADGDGKRDQIDLYLKASSGTVISSVGTEHFVHLTFAAAGEGLKPFDLPVTEDSAPASKYHAGRFDLGVGCEEDTMIIAALGKASAWSLEKKSLLWTRDLDPPFSRFAEGKAAVDCKPISVSAGVARIRSGGATVEARVDNGEDADRGRSSAGSSAGDKKPSPSSKPQPSSNTKPDPELKPGPEPESKPEPEPDKPGPKPKTKPRPKPPVPPPDAAGGKKKGKKKGGKKKGKLG